MSLSLSAGLSLNEFYDCESWEISVIISGYLKEQTRNYRTMYEVARFGLVGTLGSEDIEKIVFEWEKDPNKMTPELWETTRRNFKIWEENHRKELNGSK